MSVPTTLPQTYRESAVLTAPPELLVVILYDGARRFLYQASVAMTNGQIELSHRKLRRVEDILLHLQSTLDMEQGQIAARLEAIYLFCERHIRQARVDRDPSKLEFVSGLLGQLRESWAAIAQQ